MQKYAVLPKVHDLKRDRAFESRVDRGGRKMHQESTTGVRAATLNAGGVSGTLLSDR